MCCDTYFCLLAAWSGRSLLPRQKLAWGWRELNSKRSGRMRTFPGTLDLLPFCQQDTWFLVRGFASSACTFFKVTLLTAWSLPVLVVRPLPEEEELDDELFAGTSEEGDAGNLLQKFVFYDCKDFLRVRADGNTCIWQLYLVKIWEMLLLFSKKLSWKRSSWRLQSLSRSNQTCMHATFCVRETLHDVY